MLEMAAVRGKRRAIFRTVLPAELGQVVQHLLLIAHQLFLILWGKALEHLIVHRLKDLHTFQNGLTPLFRYGLSVPPSVLGVRFLVDLSASFQGLQRVGHCRR